MEQCAAESRYRLARRKLPKQRSRSTGLIPLYGVGDSRHGGNFPDLRSKLIKQKEPGRNPALMPLLLI